MSMKLGSRQYLCPVCGRIFTLPGDVSPKRYTYQLSMRNPETKKMEKRKCCSYSCFRKAQG